MRSTASKPFDTRGCIIQDLPCTLNWGYMVPNSGGYLSPNRGYNYKTSRHVLHNEDIQVEGLGFRGFGGMQFVVSATP